jgi:hypothetical protein
MKKIIRTVYQTNCGKYHYETEEECLEHDIIVFELDAIMSDLKWFKLDEYVIVSELDFYNSRDYIQQDINVFRSVRQRVLEYLYNLTGKKEFEVALKNDYIGVNFDHLIHILEWTDYRYLTEYLFRLMNIDSDGKEFSSFYNVLHKNEHDIKEIKI